MNALTRILGLFILTLLISGNSFAQKANYTTNGGLTIGLGVGSAYQNSDLENSKGLGFDFTLGSQLYGKRISFISFDWKFRFLAGENKAYDHRINIDTYNNIQYSFFNYDLELGLTLNRLRERTGIVISGFGGAGVTHGRTFTDLYDAGSILYDYSAIDPNRDSELVYNDLLAISDGDFETSLVNKASLLPSAGFFIGYQFSPSFTLGIEYKTNFYLTEHNSFAGIDLDNKEIPGSALDRNSYISAGLKWNLRGGSSGSGMNNFTQDVSESYKRSDNTVSQVSIPGPSVNITDPIAESSHTATINQTIKAIVNNVSRQQDINFYQNGYANNNFSYNVSTKTFTASVRLREGENSFKITASNQSAKAEDMVRITLDQPVKTVQKEPVAPYNPPVNQVTSTPETIALPGVKFINPAVPVAVQDSRFSLRAGTQNVSRRDDITMSINGINIGTFSFNTYNGVSASLNLAEGVSHIEITVRNEAGSASARTSITYNKPLARVTPSRTSSTSSSTNSGAAVKTVIIHDKVVRDQKKPVPEKPVVRESVGRKPVVIEPAVREPAGRKPLVRNPVGRKPVVEDPVVEEPIVVEPVVEEPVVEEPVVEEPVVEEPVVEEPVVEEPVVEEPVVEEPVVEEPVVEEPVVEEPVVEEELPCGVRINPGNSSWQFCMVTPSGTFNRENLNNSNFSYSGSATSLYFKPIGGGGDAIVNGSPYTLRSGQYYLFTGNLYVTLSTSNPGSMGQWSVCISSNKAPVTGNGNNRPGSPCEEGNGDGDDDSKNKGKGKRD